MKKNCRKQIIYIYLNKKLHDKFVYINFKFIKIINPYKNYGNDGN